MKKRIIAIVASVGMALSLTPVAANAVSNGAESATANCTYRLSVTSDSSTVSDIKCPTGTGVRAWVGYYPNDNTRLLLKKYDSLFRTSGISRVVRDPNTFAGGGGAEEA